jgi:GNAT superfamily N-acetyltransferase
MSLFAGNDLAARIERAESRLVAEGTERAIRRGVGGAFVRPLAGGVAVFAGAGSPFAKVAGLGFGGPLDESELAAVEAEYRRRDAAVRVELSSLGDPSVAPRLSRRGYVLHGFENVLGAALPPPVADGQPGVEVLEGAEQDDACWLETVVEGFAHPDDQGVPSDESFPREAVEAAIGDMAGVAGYGRYLARVGGVVAGGASMVRVDGVAILCGAATLPGHRRRGVQTALLAARLERAARDGCDVAVITTQPGSRSQQNAQRRGFSLLYTRALLVKQP